MDRALLKRVIDYFTDEYGNNAKPNTGHLDAWNLLYGLTDFRKLLKHIRNISADLAQQHGVQGSPQVHPSP